jgi:hypothetical protein
MRWQCQGVLFDGKNAGRKSRDIVPLIPLASQHWSKLESASELFYLFKKNTKKYKKMFFQNVNTVDTEN